MSSNHAHKPGDIFAFSNGLLRVVEGADGELIEHSPIWFSTSCLPYSFDHNADCPAWQSFLEDVFDGDAERIDLLQKWFGLMLTCDTRYQKMLLLVGPKRSGKGTILRMLQYIVGSDACACPTLSGLASEFGLWPLVDKTVAILADTHLGRKEDSMRALEVLKAVSGEDPTNINRKNLAYLRGVRLKVRFSLAVNELPHFVDPSGALTERLLILPFNKSFAGREDRTLETQFQAEAPGIFNWSLSGRYRLRQEGFRMPAAAAAIFDSFERLVSPTKVFVMDCAMLAPNARVDTARLYQAFIAWAAGNGHEKCSAATFGTRLQSAYPTIQRRRKSKSESRGYFYEGVGLTAEGEALLSETV